MNVLNIMKSLWILTRWDYSCEIFVLRKSRILYCANDLEVRTFLNCRWLLFYLGIVVVEVWTFPNSHYRSQMSFSYLGKIPYVDVRIDLKFGVFRTESQKILGDGTEILLVDRFRATREPVKKRDSNTEKDKTFPLELTAARKICYFVNTYARMFFAQTHECFCAHIHTNAHKRMFCANVFKHIHVFLYRHTCMFCIRCMHFFKHATIKLLLLEKVLSAHIVLKTNLLQLVTNIFSPSTYKSSFFDENMRA